MKTTYIYLNTYKTNGVVYYYIGSHTWSGLEGVLDPNYQGSSRVANRYKWTPSSIKILEVVSPERQFKAESEWIIKYASNYGIADCALRLAKNNIWVSKFKAHGLMLNLHANTCEQAIKLAHTQESINKQQLTRKLNGSNIRFSQAGTIKASSKESRAKALNTIKSNSELMKRMMSGCHSKESVTKSAQKRSLNLRNNLIEHNYLKVYKDNTLIFHGNPNQCSKFLNFKQQNLKTQLYYRAKRYDDFEFYGYHFIKTCDKPKSTYNTKFSIKSVETRKNNVKYSSRKKVQVYHNEQLVVEGYLKSCCEFLGNVCWRQYLGKQFNNGCTEILHHGYLFKLI